MTVDYYLVTFDLLDSKGRENEYDKVRRRLRFLVGSQDYCRVVKQCCLIRTEIDKTTVRQSIEQTIGSNSNTLIVPLRYGYSMRIKDPATRRQAKAFLESIPRN